jgi:AraC-like DNA-binding protein
MAARRPRERFDLFKGLVDDLFCPMEMNASNFVRDSFQARLDAASFGTVQLVRVATSPVSVRRRGEDIAHIVDPPYLVKFQLKGESLWSQRGREVHARPGDFVICSTAEPYCLTFFGEYEMPVLVVAESTMRRLTPNPDQFLGRRMPGDEADCGLLSGFIAQIAARMHKLPEEMLHRVEANVLDLLGAVLSVRAQHGAATREQLLTQIKAYLQDHLHDRHLGPATVARAFGISTRLVHALFEPEPATMGCYIRKLRVASCRRTLESADSTRLSLTAVALQWGFYDLSHMTRCFRDEYGEPPGRFLLHQRNA